MLDLIIKLLINFVVGAIVMVAHETPKVITAHYLTHPIYRPNHIKFPSVKKFIDPIGLILFTFSSFGMGWQKPYEYNPNRLTEKNRSLLPIAISGQLFSLVCFVALMPVIRMYLYSDVNPYLFYGIITLAKFSLIIFVVNLLPVPPLDMSKIIYAISPNTYFRLVQNERYIHTAFILLVAFRLVDSIVSQLFLLAL